MEKLAKQSIKRGCSDSEQNGSMARNFEEVKKLGKEMDQAKTGTELEEDDHKTPDPLQNQRP
ncbi:hypothetical protein [Neobacillus dielmonensis]|uniref:hypothetical protein n=1 Tax=Neobacillus dielmonensis TaxID=1347369 RepID=UPI0005A64C04|nr:hypothetical protein [Neobacillus dielmonensis]